MSTGLSIRFPQTPPQNSKGVSYLSPRGDAIFSSKQNHPSPIGTSPAEDRFHIPREKSNSVTKPYDLFCSKSNSLEIHSFLNAEFPGYPKSNTDLFNNQFEKSFVSSLSNDKSPRLIQPTQGTSPRLFKNSPSISPARDYDDLNNEQSWEEWINGMGGMEGMEAEDIRYGEYVSRNITPMRDLSPFSQITSQLRDLSPFSRQNTPMRDSSSFSQTPPIRDQSPFTHQHLIQLRDPSPYSRQNMREIRHPSPSRPLTSASDSGRLMKPAIVTSNDKNYPYTSPTSRRQMQNWTDPIVRRGRTTKPPPQNFYQENRARSRSPSPVYYSNGVQKGQECYSISPSPSPPLSPHKPSKGNQTPTMNLRVQSPLKQVPNSHLQVSQSAPDNDRQRNNFEGEDAKTFYINIHQSTHSPSLSPRPSPSKSVSKPAGPSSLSSSPSHHHSQYRYRHKAKANRHRQSNKRDDYLSKFEIHLDKINQGEDLRTTLMVKNIPNKYDQEMLLETINKKFKGTYDFFYLPIDFKNKCNVGYAFINFIDYITVARFFDEFNQKRWEKFNSEKVCCVAYARIQGKLAFIDHFRNSSLMSEDPSCRPLIFYSSGTKMGTMEPFPPANMSPARARYVSNEDD